ncbi:MAG: hypothetical protein U9O82_01765, partial [Thermodesulfobacteriota bacterium]|nr:hypothetical protein [Thermodesulfobacteriota bacterium]
GLTATHLEAIPSTRNPQKSAAIPPVSSTRDHSNLHHIETLKCEVISEPTLRKYFREGTYTSSTKVNTLKCVFHKRGCQEKFVVW